MPRLNSNQNSNVNTGGRAGDIGVRRPPQAPELPTFNGIPMNTYGMVAQPAMPMGWPGRELIDTEGVNWGKPDWFARAEELRAQEQQNAIRSQKLPVARPPSKPSPWAERQAEIKSWEDSGWGWIPPEMEFYDPHDAAMSAYEAQYAEEHKPVAGSIQDAVKNIMKIQRPGQTLPGMPQNVQGPERQNQKPKTNPALGGQSFANASKNARSNETWLGRYLNEGPNGGRPGWDEDGGSDDLPF